MLRKRRTPPRDIFPIDPWKLRVVRYDPSLALDYVGQGETMFALSNGFLGIRGTMDEGTPSDEPGVVLNGFYETRPITYGESAYGFPREGQSLLPCPDGSVIRLFVDDEPFDATEAEIVDFRRELDVSTGLLCRDLRWTSPRGKTIRLRTTRIVSLAMKNLAAMNWRLEIEDADADVVISSEMVERQPQGNETDDPRLAEGHDALVLESAGTDTRELRSILSFKTLGSGLTLACGMDHTISTANGFTASTNCEDRFCATVIQVDARQGEPIELCKYLAYDYDAGQSGQQMRGRTGWTLDRALDLGFPSIADRQKSDIAAFWARTDVEIDDELGEVQQVVRWSLFQLLQASERVEGHGIGARGLTGRTYEGHYFWDTEIYVLPFLIYTAPTVARNLLKFRAGMLPQARQRAIELGHRGATFPWRTINGREASAYYAAGTAQYHINADIVYAMRKYVEVTGDTGFLLRYGAEVAIETARFWHDLGFFSARRDGRFCINAVTGPDEYTAVVDNNYFTNIMAQENMRYAAKVVEDIAGSDPAALQALAQRTGLAPEEPAAWREAAERMYLPFDERLGVHPQDDSFLDKEVWDFANTPEESYPLLLYHHPLNLYRTQVIKQADTLLAMFLLRDRFSAEEMRRDFDYYDPLTTHDSSLSVCIQSIIANEIGYTQKAFDYFDFAATMDISDIGGNVRNGAHVASIGGTWMALAYGFAGLRDGHGDISFHPRPPSQWNRLCFPLTIRGSRIRISIEHDSTCYRLESGDGLAFTHCGQAVELTRDRPEARLATPVPPPTPQ